MSDKKQDESFVKAGVMGIGALVIGSFALGLLKTEEPPPTNGNGGGSSSGVSITGVDWEELSFPYLWYGQEQTVNARFFKGKVHIVSDYAFTGRIALTCGDAIAAVPLMTDADYQALLLELDNLIAESTGRIQELWQVRKQVALQFPEVDGFYIDFRWFDPDGWWWMFTQSWMLGSTATIYYWNDIAVGAGETTVDVGFFTRHNVGIATPATVSLLSDDQVLASILSDVVSPGSIPQILSASMPQTVMAGDDFSADLELYLPELLAGQQYYGVKLRMGSDEQASVSLVANFVSQEVTNASQWHKLTSPDGRYQAGVTLKTVYRSSRYSSYEPLPPGMYLIKASIDSWRVSNASGSGIAFYEQIAKYDYGELGQIEVT